MTRAYRCEWVMPPYWPLLVIAILILLGLIIATALPR